MERHREDYLDDNGFWALQNLLMKHPEAGDLIQDPGGLRKLRYWWNSGFQFWPFTPYDKDEMADLTPKQRVTLKAMIKAELEMRRKI